MADIKRLNRTLSTNNSMSRKILNELSEMNKALHDQNRRVENDRLRPFQTKDSPYFPDREYSNPLAVKGNAEETKWKEVPTYEDNYERNIVADKSDYQETLVVVNKKKLNII